MCFLQIEGLWQPVLSKSAAAAAKSLQSCLTPTPWTAAYEAPPSVEWGPIAFSIEQVC